MITETCSCGASIQVPTDGTSETTRTGYDASDRVTTTEKGITHDQAVRIVGTWRSNHRHDGPAAAEAGEEIRRSQEVMRADFSQLIAEVQQVISDIATAQRAMSPPPERPDARMRVIPSPPTMSEAEPDLKAPPGFAPDLR